MTNFFSMSVYLIIGYIVGIWFAAPGLFSAIISATAWSNIWVYVYLIFWPFILIWHFIVFVIVFVAVVLFAVGIYVYLRHW